MGTYTELVFEGRTVENIPSEVAEVLGYLFSEERGSIPKYLPKHSYFLCDRWEHIGDTNSYYHIPMSVSKIRQDVNYRTSYNIFTRCDLKNYDNEIAKFIDWISPYMGRYRGWYLQEEDTQPTLFGF